MGSEPSVMEVNAALSRVRRRERLLQQARGTWDWSELVGLVISQALALYLIFSDEGRTSSGFGFAMLIGGGAVWQIRRLQSRVDALTKLLDDADVPEAMPERITGRASRV